MKALILFGSGRKNGNTAALANTFAENFAGDVEFLYVYPHLAQDKKGILACTGCEACKSVPCVQKDDFHKLTDGNFDVLVIASPIFMSNLTPPMWNVVSRFNYLFHQIQQKEKMQETQENAQNEKQGVLLLAAGGHACKKLQGKDNFDLPVRQAEYICAKLNVSLPKQNVVISAQTDTMPAKDDFATLEKIKLLAKNLSQTVGAEHTKNL